MEFVVFHSGRVEVVSEFYQHRVMLQCHEFPSFDRDWAGNEKVGHALLLVPTVAAGAVINISPGPIPCEEEAVRDVKMVIPEPFA